MTRTLILSSLLATTFAVPSHGQRLLLTRHLTGKHQRLASRLRALRAPQLVILCAFLTAF
jgi:hypothetical protein